MSEQCKKVYISFGQIDVHSVVRESPLGGRVTLNKDSIAVIRCEDYSAGREKAFKLFNGKFHECWSEKEWRNSDHLKYFPRGLIEI